MGGALGGVDPPPGLSTLPSRAVPDQNTDTTVSPPPLLPTSELLKPEGALAGQVQTRHLLLQREASKGQAAEATPFAAARPPAGAAP